MKKLKRYNFIDSVRRQIACCEADVITWDSLWCWGHEVAELEASHAELLVAAKRLLSLYESHGWQHPAINAARAAIAKAEVKVMP